jgi:NADH-quinone oxidoreductase subunit M
VVLAGLLLKTGAYGLIRFSLPLFPNASGELAPGCMVIAVIGIIYGAVMAFAQTDLKRLIAYSSISHMGFVLLGVFVGSEAALQGALMQIICHGIATGALFIIAGAIQGRTGTRDMGRLGGLWETAPRMGAAALFFAMASLGLPGLGNFVGEFLVLLASYRVNIVITVIAATGVVSATVYSLWFIQRVFHGQGADILKGGDLMAREVTIMLVMMAALLWLGLFPQQIFNISQPALKNLRITSVSGQTEILVYRDVGDAGEGHFPEGFRK